mgnify:CR=1 FL=1
MEHSHAIVFARQRVDASQGAFLRKDFQIRKSATQVALFRFYKNHYKASFQMIERLDLLKNIVLPQIFDIITFLLKKMYNWFHAGVAKWQTHRF